MSEPNEVQNTDEVEEEAHIVVDPYTITVDLKWPIQYGAYKQSFYRCGISSHEMYSAPSVPTLKIWAGDHYEYIPIDNVVKWSITDNMPQESIETTSEESQSN